MANTERSARTLGMRNVSGASGVSTWPVRHTCGRMRHAMRLVCSPAVRGDPRCPICATPTVVSWTAVWCMRLSV